MIVETHCALYRDSNGALRSQWPHILERGHLTVRVAVLDAGAVRNLGWAAVDVDTSDDLEGEWNNVRPAYVDTALASLVTCVAEALDRGDPVALGFECPCFVPVREREVDLLKQRCGEEGKAFSAAAGAFVTVDGLVETAWVLAKLGGRGRRATVDPSAWPHCAPLFLWEAFVSGKGKSGYDARSAPGEWPGGRVRQDVRDAATAAKAFVRKGRPTLDRSDITTCGASAFNTLAAAALRAGLMDDVGELKLSSYVIKAE